MANSKKIIKLFFSLSLISICHSHYYFRQPLMPPTKQTKIQESPQPITAGPQKTTQAKVATKPQKEKDHTSYKPPTTTTKTPLVPPTSKTPLAPPTPKTPLVPSTLKTPQVPPTSKSPPLSPVSKTLQAPTPKPKPVGKLCSFH